MSKLQDIQSMPDVELLDTYAADDRNESPWPAARDELLRRLSAGNPQAEKVQISAENAMREAMFVSGTLKSEPERSDGRIQGELCVCGETETASGGDVHCSGDCDDAFHNEPGGCHRYNPPQAQRSAGRIEASTE